MKPRFLTISIMILTAAMTRLLPHPWNFTPVAAMALFAGASFDDLKVAIVLPLATLFIGDIFLGFHKTIPFVYGAFVLTVLFGWMIQDKKNMGSLIICSIMSSLTFFFITNFGVWLSSGMYSLTANGLVQCYIAAIPFFRTTLFGDLFFSFILFTSFYGIEQAVPVIKNSSLPIG